jgi:hypothetical protein
MPRRARGAGNLIIDGRRRDAMAVADADRTAPLSNAERMNPLLVKAFAEGAPSRSASEVNTAPLTTTRRINSTTKWLPGSPGSDDLPHVGWISRRDGTRGVGDLEDQAARYRPARSELTTTADSRATPTKTNKAAGAIATKRSGARAGIGRAGHRMARPDPHEVGLAARSTTWTAEQVDACCHPPRCPQAAPVPPTTRPLQKWLR